MFVGDSLNRNQWESMVCFVQSLIPPGRKSLNKTGSLAVFRIEVLSLLCMLFSVNQINSSCLVLLKMSIMHLDFIF